MPCDTITVLVAPQYFFVREVFLSDWKLSYWAFSETGYTNSTYNLSFNGLGGKSCLVLKIWRWGFGCWLSRTIDNSLCSLFCLSDLIAAVLLSCFEVRSRTPAASNDRNTMIVMASSSLIISEGHVFKSLVLLSLSTSLNPFCLPAACP